MIVARYDAGYPGRIDKRRVMRFAALLLFVGCLGLVACATLPGPRHPSVAGLQAIDFLGRKFVREAETTDMPVRIYYYYPVNESPGDWLERIEFKIYPLKPDGANEPLDHARRVVADFKQKYPNMEYALTSDSRSGAAYLDFFYPHSSRKEAGKGFLEFNAFKFFRDKGSRRTMSFHYLKNIEGMSAYRSMSDVSTEIINTRQDIQQAMTTLPRYHH